MLAPLVAARPKYWIDACHYTLSGSTVDAWVDLVTPSHTFALGGTMVAEPVSVDAVMGGRKRAVFAANTWYQSTAAASDWNFMSDGTGMTAFYIVRRTTAGNCVFHATQAGAARSTGYDWNYQGDGNSTLALGTNAVANLIGIPVNGDRCIAQSYDGTTVKTFSNGVKVVSGTQAPFAGAVEAMTIGADVAGAFSNNMLWCASLWFDKALQEDTVARWSGLLAAAYSTDNYG